MRRAPAHAPATVDPPRPAAPPVTGEGAGQEQPDAIDLLRRRFAKHDRPLAEVRRLVDASMGERLLTDELRAMRHDA
jgi:hypothetical protein